MHFKSFRKKGGSFIKSPEEKGKKPIPWGKYFYLTVLTLIVIIFVKWVYERVICVRGEGVLEAKTISISTTITGRITAIKHRVRDTVSEREAVVFLDRSELDNKIDAKRREIEEKNTFFRQKILDAENELRLMEKEKENQEKEVNDLREEYKKAKTLLSLEAVTRPQLLNIEYDLKSSERKLAALSTGTALTASKLLAIKKEFSVYRGMVNKEIKQLHDIKKETVLFSSVKGVVTVVLKREGEVVQPGELILKIADPSENFIKTYFRASDEDKIKLGEEVLIIFQNGDKSRGVVRKIYPAALPLPVEYKKAYGPQEMSVTAEIFPLEGMSWNRVIGTKATVIAKRKWF